VAFRCQNVLQVNDIFDDKKLTYDYHQNDCKYNKDIRSEADKINKNADEFFTFAEI